MSWINWLEPSVIVAVITAGITLWGIRHSISVNRRQLQYDRERESRRFQREVISRFINELNTAYSKFHSRLHNVSIMSADGNKAPVGDVKFYFLYQKLKNIPLTYIFDGAAFDSVAFVLFQYRIFGKELHQDILDAYSGAIVGLHNKEVIDDLNSLIREFVALPVPGFEPKEFADSFMAMRTIDKSLSEIETVLIQWKLGAIVNLGLDANHYLSDLPVEMPSESTEIVQRFFAPVLRVQKARLSARARREIRQRYSTLTADAQEIVQDEFEDKFASFLSEEKRSSHSPAAVEADMVFLKIIASMEDLEPQDVKKLRVDLKRLRKKSSR